MAYSEGYNDDTRARCRLEDGAVTITCAAAEIGQGFVTVAGQIVGAKGVGETSSLPSTPAVVAAIRAATGLKLPRVPVRPQDIAAVRS